MERLALAKPQPRPHARSARAHDRRHRRRARRDPPTRGSSAGRHDAVLHEPASIRRTRAGATPHDDADDRGVRSHPGERTTRSARTATARSGARAPVSRPRAAARHEFLLGLLPLLHAIATGRRRTASARCARPTSTRAIEYIAATPAVRDVPDLRRRPAVARRGRLDDCCRACARSRTSSSSASAASIPSCCRSASRRR